MVRPAPARMVVAGGGVGWATRAMTAGSAGFPAGGAAGASAMAGGASASMGRGGATGSGADGWAATAIVSRWRARASGPGTCTMMVGLAAGVRVGVGAAGWADGLAGSTKSSTNLPPIRLWRSCTPSARAISAPPDTGTSARTLCGKGPKLMPPAPTSLTEACLPSCVALAVTPVGRSNTIRPKPGWSPERATIAGAWANAGTAASSPATKATRQVNISRS